MWVFSIFRLGLLTYLSHEPKFLHLSVVAFHTIFYVFCQ